MTTSADAESQEEALTPVFRELGKALFIAQQFESNLLFLVALLSGKDGKLDAETFARGVEDHIELTLGRLAKAFKIKLNFPSDFEDFIREGVTTRNQIVHGYVQRNSEKLRTAVGRLQVTDELKDTQWVLEQRRIFTEQTLDRILEIFGGSKQKLRDQVNAEFNEDLLRHITRH